MLVSHLVSSQRRVTSVSVSDITNASFAPFSRRIRRCKQNRTGDSLSISKTKTSPEMDSQRKCFLCDAAAPDLCCPAAGCPVAACSQQHLALHLQPQPSPASPPLHLKPAASTSCLPYTISFQQGVGRCLVSIQDRMKLRQG